MDIQHKVFVVTGGGNGIGRELVLRLLARGGSVAAIDIDPSALEETARRASDGRNRVSLHTANLADRAAVDRLPGEVIDRHGAVDGLINNAGIIQPFVRLHALEMAAIERVMNVNFYGTLYMVRAFLPHLRSRPEAHIVNISSMGGFLPVPGQTVYGASKAAVKLLTEGLRSELLHTEVRVTVVFPGAIGTDIARNSGVSIKMPAEAGRQTMKTLSPAKAAEIIVEGIERNRPRVLVGQDAVLMDLLYRLAPVRAAEFIYNQMKALLPPD